MSVTVRVTVEDIDTQIATYNTIRIYRANSADGVFGVEGTITLVANTYHYSYADTTGTLNSSYKSSTMVSGYKFCHSPQVVCSIGWI